MHTWYQIYLKNEGKLKIISQVNEITILSSLFVFRVLISVYKVSSF